VAAPADGDLRQSVDGCRRCPVGRRMGVPDQGPYRLGLHARLPRTLGHRSLRTAAAGRAGGALAVAPPPGLRGDRATEPAAAHLFGLAHDALDQLLAARDVADDAHHRAGRPDAVLHVAGLVDHLAARAGDQRADLLDRLALELHLDRLLGHRVAEHA